MSDAYTGKDTLSVPMIHTPDSRGTGAGTPPEASNASSGPGVVSHGWLAASTEFGHADERKMGRAMSASLSLHGVAVLVIALVIAWRPPAEPPTITPREDYELLFVQVEGPGGGGGGGGNESPDPPAKLEMKAEVPEAPAVVEPPKVEMPPPPPPLMAPVVTSPTVPVQTAGVVSGLTAAPSLGTGRGGGGGTGTGTGSGPGSGSGIGDGTDKGFGGGAFRPGTGAEDPVLIRQVKPQYTPEAMRAKIQGVVELEAVVGVNGQITDVRVHKSLDRGFGLDEEAMRVAKQWLFRPARFQGKPVAMVVIIAMEFRLH
jgi:periplasmic protein TonB